MCNVGLWANPIGQDSLENNSTRKDSVQTGNVLNDNDAYLTFNDIDTIADKVVEKMKQENKEKISVMTKKIVITTGEIIIGVLVFILGIIVGLLYNKIFKKLQKMGRKQEENFRKSEHRLAVIEENVAKMAENVKRIEVKVAEEVKQVVVNPVATEDSVIRNVNMQEFRSEVQNGNMIYAKPLGNGNLKTTTEASEAIYVISVRKDNIGKFSLYENEGQKKRAIKNKDNILDLFCNAKGSSIGARTIKTLSEGEVRQSGIDTWKLTQKAEIEFIK